MEYLGLKTELLEQAQAFWTAKEICQQPDCWQQTMALIDSQRQAIDHFLAPLFEKKALRIILTGAGTSAFSGEVLVPFFNQLTKHHAVAIATTDLVSNPYQYLDEEQPTLLISFARSGNSPESAAAVQLVNQVVKHSYHLIITCNQNGKLYQDYHRCENVYALALPPQTNDNGFAMTSSFSSMTLATAIIFLQPHFAAALVKQVIVTTSQFIQQQHKRVKTIAAQEVERIVYLGSGGFKGLAQESALKLLELTAGEVVAMYDTPLGFRHGPKSIINDQTIVIVYLSNNPYTRQYDIDLCQEILRDQKVKELLILTSKPEPALPQHLQFCLDGLADETDLALAFPYVVFAQMFSFYRSLLSGHTTDNPCPSGEVNRVVQGVIIHPYQP
ncbi:SIS domain-containing protein [Testudinibacter sp. TR-2022]|uniref:SIS domain-containing protein n=1 Tax=Testudinibacter sp. TR-2022 TaxID=2585029 RepID=UPI0011187A78|nr:SIS domain-containing protein [Testudinibacter sp. TR-2022]TNH04090.1 SIS domain-containing protein [Pasteurellaceae bacterium Phil31]TNH09062.1 SIS domain-containing protein [Testudinibacter sp. TR-2022]TNH12899.1 SIS domain-containing protein [Testudinibacter sp. TR-2022]TNH13115.1 SIS domain-containing protein [Testudinibacter sp. TR-2022]TNH18202.1 SIS domain-containing protein [Testudinibacter sp. TR-2022]